LVAPGGWGRRGLLAGTGDGRRGRGSGGPGTRAGGHPAAPGTRTRGGGARTGDPHAAGAGPRADVPDADTGYRVVEPRARPAGCLSPDRGARAGDRRASPVRRGGVQRDHLAVRRAGRDAVRRVVAPPRLVRDGRVAGRGGGLG